MSALILVNALSRCLPWRIISTADQDSSSQEDLVESDLLFIVSYECPNCHVALEDRSRGSPSWQRCPRCGRASLPPDHQRWNQSPTQMIDKNPVMGTFAIGPDDLPIRPRSMAPMPPPAGSKVSNFRLMLGCGLFASLVLGVFSLLESNVGLTILAGFAAILCLVLLFVPGRGTTQD